MAKIPLEKVAIFVHISERDKLLQRLQDEGILHFAEFKAELKDSYATIHPDEVKFESELETLINRLDRAIKFLEPFAKKKSFVESLIEKKEGVSYDEFLQTAQCIEPGSLLVQAETLEQELNHLNQIESNIKAQMEFISPWVNLQYPVEEIKESNDVVYLPGIIPSNAREKLDSDVCCFEIINEEDNNLFVIAVYLKKDEDNARQFLQQVEFKQVEFHGYHGLPKDILAELGKELLRIEEEKKTLNEVIQQVARNFKKLLILHDYVYSLYNREIIDNKGLKTNLAVIYTGYVKRGDLERLQSIMDEFSTAYFEVIKPEKGEAVPVLIENKKVFKPFEGLVKMYGLPSESDPDPTVLITPFFILFFGICFGDAAYGLILALLSYFVMKKLKISGGLLWILIVGGLLSVVFGTLTGSIFGDFFERANWTIFNDFRKKLMLFDPMKDVMVFFALTLVLGFIQILVGLGVNAWKKIQEGDFLGALSQPIAWIFILLSLAYKGVLARKINISILNQISTALILLFVGLMVVFNSRQSRNFIIRLVKGAYNVYNGVGFIGDLLSYVRLMALGMTSSGIAMAINILTLLVWQIPILGYILGPIVFIFGHLFSVLINILGSIVHPLRLQYVEFFKQFYDDGGVAFEPLSWTGKYTEITKN